MQMRLSQYWVSFLQNRVSVCEKLFCVEGPDTQPTTLCVYSSRRLTLHRDVNAGSYRVVQLSCSRRLKLAAQA